MSFDIKDSIYNIDGDKSEWTNNELISTNDNILKCKVHVY